MNFIFCLISIVHAVVPEDPYAFPFSRRDVYVFLGGAIFCWSIFVFLQRRSIVVVAKEIAPSVVPAESNISDQLTSISDILKTSLMAVHNPEKFTVLVFGPAITGKSGEDSTVGAVRQKRQDVRRALENLKFTVYYGEDIEDVKDDELIRLLHMSLKEKLLGRGVDAILIMASSEGPAAEVGIFSQYPELCKKMVIAVHQKQSRGFLVKGPCAEAETHGAKLFIYSHQQLTCCEVQTRLVSEALRLYQGKLSRSRAWQPKF